MKALELAQRCLIGLPGPELDPELEALLEEFTPRGVVLFRRNLTSDPWQIKGLIESLQAISLGRNGRPMIVAIDQEGGPVKRLPPPFGQYPAAASYGPEGEAAVQNWGLRQGRELAALGVTLNLAPVLDVNTLGQEGIMKERAFGADPETVSRLGLAAIRGLHEAGVAACAKHFPGIGHSTLDSHRTRPVVQRSLEELRACELPPFRAAVAAGVEAVMVGHLVYPALDAGKPASLSRAVIQELLREEMGYRGLILSDDLQMGAVTGHLSVEEAALAALDAGTDLVLICQDLAPFKRLMGL